MSKMFVVLTQFRDTSVVISHYPFLCSVSNILYTHQSWTMVRRSMREYADEINENVLVALWKARLCSRGRQGTTGGSTSCVFLESRFYDYSVSHNWLIRQSFLAHYFTIMNSCVSEDSTITPWWLRFCLIQEQLSSTNYSKRQQCNPSLGAWIRRCKEKW